MHWSHKSNKIIDPYDKALLSRSLEIGSHPFIRGLSASTPQILYASLFTKPRCNHLERIQRLASRLVTGMHHLAYEERLQRLGLHSLQQPRLQAGLFTAFKIFTSHLDIYRNLLFLLLARSGRRGHPYKVLQGASHRQRRESAFSVRVVKYWSKRPDSVVTAPSVNVFKKGLEKVWIEVFPHFPHWLNKHLPIALAPIPPAHPH